MEGKMLIGDMRDLVDKAIANLDAEYRKVKWSAGTSQPGTLTVQGSQDGETWAYVSEWTDLSGARYSRAASDEDRLKRAVIAASPLRALCGPHKGYAPAFMKAKHGQYRCLECHARLTNEAGPSAVAAAPAREPWMPSVCEWDLLPDAGR